MFPKEIPRLPIDNVQMGGVVLDSNQVRQIFGASSSSISSRVLVYKGGDCEYMAKTHVFYLEKMVSLLESMPVEITIMGIPDPQDKNNVTQVILGFPSAHLNNITQAISYANRELKAGGIKEIPEFPQLSTK